MCITRDTVYPFVCHTQRTIQTCFYCVWCLLSVKPYTLGSSFVCLRFPCICGGKLWRWCSRCCVTPVGFRPGDSWPLITNSLSRTEACSVSHVTDLHSGHVALTLPGTGMTLCVRVCGCRQWAECLRPVKRRFGWTEYLVLNSKRHWEVSKIKRMDWVMSLKRNVKI